MKGTRFYKLISIMLSVMLVFSLFPTQALADNADNSEPLPIYTVKFFDWDGTLIDSVQVEQGSDATAPSHPDREGYVAAGWDKSYSNVQENLSVTALYQEITEPTPSLSLLASAPTPSNNNSITVSFYAKNGSFVESYTITGLTNSDVHDLPNKGLNLLNALNDLYHSNTGSYFLGMSEFGSNDITNNGSLDVYGSSPNYTTRVDLNFNPSAAYKIQYLSTGGKTLADEVTGTGNVGSQVTAIAKTFVGYNLTSPSPQTIKLELSGNLIVFLYAPITYSISYALNNGTNAAGNPTSYSPDSDTITLLNPTRNGYNFTGWAPEGTIASGSTGNKSFSAGWAPIAYAINYNLNGGVNAGTNPATYTIATPTFSLAAPTRNGYTFAGWSPTGTITLGSTGDKTFTALWTPKTYQIQYNLAGGTNAAGNPSEYTPASPTITLLNPTREGYVFDRWSPEGVIPTGTFGDLYFTAIWVPVTYGIGYTLNGGTNATGNPDHYTPDDAEIVLLDPSRDGYTFSNWSPAGVIPTGSTGEKSFEAFWTANTYEIKYDLAGGVNALGNPVEYTPDSATITLLEPTRAGYTFAGWSPEGVIPTGSFGEKNFTALWFPITYAIRYELNGGTNASGNPTEYTPDSATITLLNPSRTGYTFNGWTPAGEIVTGSIGDKTFTASWKANTYTVSYTLNGGTNAAGNPTSFKTDSPTITLLNPTKSGYTFAGWSPSNSIPTGTTENKTFVANWAATEYTITYVLNGGTNAEGNPAIYTVESDRINLLPPTRDGYTFVSWSPRSYIAAGSTGNKTFTANWTATKYRIFYTLNGGVNSLLNPYGYDVEDNTITLNDAFRLGYNFTGWTPEGVIPKGSTGDKSFAAGWTPKVYNITYELWGGTNAASNPSSYTVESPTIKLADPVKPGYNFVGWLASDTIRNGSVGDRYFVAVWSFPIRYSISYELNGGVNASSNPTGYRVTSDTITLAAPTRVGYTFSGWTPEGVIPNGSSGNKTFTANWTPIAYSITYDLAGGSATGNPDSYTIETETFTLNNPTRDNYTFAGWSPADATIEKGSTGNLSFTATWTPVSYSISYDLAGGMNAATNPASYTVESETFTLADPTRDYYDFSGWTPADTTIEQGSSGNLSFTASWTPIVYTISYDVGLGLNAPTNPTQYTVESETFTLADPTRPGFNFEGWNPADATIEQGSHGNLSFTAIWSAPNVYSITYDLAGGVNAATNPVSYTVESADITLAAPTRAGYTFLGWTPEGTIPAGSTGDRAFTATWSAPIIYGIVYVLNGGVNAAGNPATYTVESAAITLAAPTRAGYNFTGWTPAGGIPAGSTGGRTFTATWSAPIEYPINYVLNGGVNALANPVSYNVTSGLIVLAEPSRTGYDFLGWTPTGTIPAASTGERTFTATWSQPHVHTVTYFVSGGTQAGLDGNTPFAVYRDVAYGSPVPIPDDPAEAEYTFDGWSSDIPTTMPDEDIVFYGTLTKSQVLQEIITNERTPLAGPTWSLLNLILTALTALGVGSIISMLIKKRKGTGSSKDTLFSLLTLVPAAGAIIAFLLTQITSGSMVFADRWSILMGVITLGQGALVSLGIFGNKKNV